MKGRVLTFVFAAAVVLSACRSVSPPKAPAVLSQTLGTNAFNSVSTFGSIQKEWLSPSPDFFRLGPGDIIEVEVIGAKEAPTQVQVGPDGKIYYSLLPGLFVWGLSLSE